MLDLRAAPADSAEARELLRAYFDERTATFPPDSGIYRAALPEAGMFADGVFLVADLDGAPVGCGGIRRVPAAEPAVRYEVKHLYLLPAARGSGGGRALMDELEHRARALGATELVLDTNRVLESAGALYARLGYLSVPPYNDNPNATDWYRKELPPAERMNQ